MVDTKQVVQKLPLPTVGTRVKQAIKTIEKACNGGKNKANGPEAPR